MSIIAIKAINRGIKAKQKLNKDKEIISIIKLRLKRKKITLNKIN